MFYVRGEGRQKAFKKNGEPCSNEISSTRLDASTEPYMDGMTSESWDEMINDKTEIGEVMPDL